MHFFLIFLFLSAIVLLFCLYVIGKEDLLFIRRGVTLEQLFNIAILAMLFGLFTARIFHVLLNPSTDYLNILVFLLFPYFPGLTFIGGVLGGALFILLYARFRKLPKGRILDFIALSLLGAAPVGYLGTIFLHPKINLFESIFLPVIYLLLFLLCLKVVFPRLIRGEIKNGSLGTLLLMTFSFISFVIGLARSGNEVFYFLGIEDAIALVVVVVAIILFLKEEMFVTKVKK